MSFFLTAVGLRNIMITAEESLDVVKTCGSVDWKWSGKTKHIVCNSGTKGRFLKFSNRVDGVQLTLCYVKVIGAYGK